MSLLSGVAASLPWLVLPVVLYRRSMNATSADYESSDVPADPPLVTVIVPARNEAENIARCVTSILGTNYPSLEVIVVNDHSDDRTAEIVGELAQTDNRVRLFDSPQLPDGWFGKQWACQTGADQSKGPVLLFTDADTIHRPDSLVRAVNAMIRAQADLLSVLPRQRLESFWERVLQPQVFTLLAARFGGTEHVTHSPRKEDKLVNGQYLLVKKATYDSAGGHASVRGSAVDDLSLAQLFFSRGGKVVLTHGANSVSTRMYTSLGSVVRGWGKNIYAGVRLSFRKGPLRSVVYPSLLLLFFLFQLAPMAMLIAGITGMTSSATMVWSIVSVSCLLIWWTAVYMLMQVPPWHALVFPVGAAVMLYICAGAILRGRTVAWKGRVYRSE